MKLPVKAFHMPQRTETAAELRDATDRLIAVFERIEAARNVADRLNGHDEVAERNSDLEADLDDLRQELGDEQDRVEELEKMCDRLRDDLNDAEAERVDAIIRADRLQDLLDELKSERES